MATNLQLIIRISSLFIQFCVPLRCLYNHLPHEAESSPAGFEIGIYGWPSGTWGNDNLVSLQGLSNLAGLDNINPASIGNLTIDYNAILSTCEVQSVCDYLHSPNGTISIQGNASGCGDQAEME